MKKLIKKFKNPSGTLPNKENKEEKEEKDYLYVSPVTKQIVVTPEGVTEQRLPEMGNPEATGIKGVVFAQDNNKNYQIDVIGNNQKDIENYYVHKFQGNINKAKSDFGKDYLAPAGLIAAELTPAAPVVNVALLGKALYDLGKDIYYHNYTDAAINATSDLLARFTGKTLGKIGAQELKKILNTEYVKVAIAKLTKEGTPEAKAQIKDLYKSVEQIKPTTKVYPNTQNMIPVTKGYSNYD